MNYKEEIIKNIDSLSGKYNPYQVFFDWVYIMALTISNSTDMIKGPIWKEREARYMELASRYSSEEMHTMCLLFTLLSMSYEDKIEDVLGYIYMKSGAGNNRLGQFFTPFHISDFVAKIGMEQIIPGKKYPIFEPSCGAGGMIIAAAKHVIEQGGDIKCLKVVAQDLDWLGVYMTYVQLSLIGIDAVVAQGDSLKNEIIPENRKFRTPVNKGMIWNRYKFA